MPSFKVTKDELDLIRRGLISLNTEITAWQKSKLLHLAKLHPHAIKTTERLSELHILMLRLEALDNDNTGNHNI